MLMLVKDATALFNFNVILTVVVLNPEPLDTASAVDAGSGT